MKEIGQFSIQEKGRSVFFLGLIQSTIIARGQYCSPFKWKEVEDDYHSKRKKEERVEERGIGKLTSETIFDYCFGLSLFTNAENKYCKQERVTFYYANNLFGKQSF